MAVGAGDGKVIAASCGRSGNGQKPARVVNEHLLDLLGADPVREQSYKELGLQTVCPTVMGANAICEMLEA